MTHTHFFELNIPKENQTWDSTNQYLRIIAMWNNEDFYSDGKPMVFVELVNPSMQTCMKVKDWVEMEKQIKQVAHNHFAELARQERINKAKAELIAAGEIIDNPILARYEPNNAITLTEY